MNYSLIDEHSVAIHFLPKKIMMKSFVFIYLCKSIKNSPCSGIAG